MHRGDKPDCIQLSLGGAQEGQHRRVAHLERFWVCAVVLRGTSGMKMTQIKYLREHNVKSQVLGMFLVCYV